MAYSNFTAAKIQSKNHHWLMINTEYVRVKMSKCLSSFVQATAVHFFSVKLLKKSPQKGSNRLMKPGLGFTVINRTSSAAFQHLQVVIIYSVNFY